ncbi:MAG: P-loop NTPase fold protein [Desulfobacterales bacterium]|nr:P-loop NTPase fold protein [Desulfobacterales bacterium]
MPAPLKDKPYNEFLSILNNVDEKLSKDQGVLLLVGPARDLRLLEEACFDSDQTWNSVITARYTLIPSAPENVFGTLASSLIADVSRWPSTDDNYGTLREFGSERLQKFRRYPVTWEQLTHLAKTIDDAMPLGDDANLDTSLITDAIRRELDSRKAKPYKGQKQKKQPTGMNDFLKTGQRMVLFLQLDGEVENPEAWSGFLNKLANFLPYRVMLVIAGLPDEVKLDPDIHSQRRLILEPGQYSEIESPEKKEAVAYKENPAISDEPSTSDELGRRPYANALARMVLHKQTVPPLSVGIHGPWGKGKSSFMAQIREELGEVGKAAETPIVTVDFNAWRYDDATQVWAGLLNKVSAGIEKKLGHWRTLRINLWHAISTRTAELFWVAALPLLIFFAAVGLGWLLGVNGLEILRKLIEGRATPSELEKALLPALGGVGSLLFLFKRLAQATQPISARIANFARLPSYSKELGFQHAVIDDLQFLQKALQNYRSGARVVVFIDDLDRCSEERIMEILQAIILVLAPANFFVFLGIDTDMIYRAIREHYTTDGNPPARSFPRHYLRKILQLSFHLPPIEKTERENLLDTLFSKESVDDILTSQTMAGDTHALPKGSESSLPPLRVDLSLLRETDALMRKERLFADEEMVMDTPHELAAFRAYQDCLDDNPREIKRAVNIHRLMKLMMQKQGLPDSGWTIQRQRQLVRWVLFCTCWPELVGHALRIAEQGDSDTDVLQSCSDEYAAEVKDPKRRERLKAIAAQDSDELPPATVDSHLKFVARSSLLVEEVDEPGEDEYAVEMAADPEAGAYAAEGGPVLPELLESAQRQKGNHDPT